jgi:Protein of unknown function (DUF1570)/FHA domain
MLEFLIKVKGQPDRTVECDADSLVAGSARAAELRIPDPAAADRHFEISTRSVGIVLRHLAADGETRVNGVVVNQVRLGVGDVIEVGAATIVFARHGVVAPAPAVPNGGEPRPAPRAPRTAARSGSLGPTVLLVFLVLAAGTTVYLLNRGDKEDITISLLPYPEGGEEGGASGNAGTPGVDGSASGEEDLRRPWLEPTAGIEPEPEPMVEPVPADAPDPAPVPAASIPDHSEEERHRQEARVAAAREELQRFDELLPARIERYAFDVPIRDLRALLEVLPDGALRGEIEGRLEDLSGAARTFDRMRETVSAGKDRAITLESGLKLLVVGTDETGFDARVGKATVRKKWVELSPETIHAVAVEGRPDADRLIDAAAFAALYDMVPEAEADLLTAYRQEEDRRPAISAALARHRGVDLPPGGFVLYQDRFVTTEEFGYLEQGLVEYDGKWMTKEEALTAQGYVLHEGQWLSPEDWDDVLEALREAEDLAKKYLPKGFIDQVGKGEAVPWAQATEIKTRHYKIRTNLSRDVAKDIAYTMEILRTNLAHQFGLRGKGARFTINVTANRGEYRTNWRAAGGSLGFCSGSEICTFYQPPMTTSVLMHEGTHQMLQRFESNCPRWLHEGMATYFECSKFEFDPQRKRVNLRVGLLNAMRLANFQAELASGRAVPLETFMKGEAGNPYTQGWAFVYYLAKGKDGIYAKNLHTFIGEAHKADVVERFQKIFRVKDLAEFEKEWLEYIKALDPAKGVRLAGNHQ